MGETTINAHGGLLEEELVAFGLSAEDVLDVSVNVNPYGPCPAVTRAIFEASIHRYPDPTASPARQALSRFLDIAATRVVLGNGAVDLLWTLARAVLRPGDATIIVEPAFSEMRSAALRTGAKIVEYRTSPEADFATEPRLLDALVHQVRPRLCYVCTPSNPAGICTPIEALNSLAERHPATVFVVDLSFCSLSERHDDAKGPLSERIVWVRSLTKDHALAGLRVGCVVAPTEIATRLEAERPPWSVNALAQAAAIATTSIEAIRFVDDSRERLLRDRAHLVDCLRRLDLRVHRTETIYTLVDLGSRVSATDLRAAMLLRHRVLVRDGTSFGLPHHIRVAARPREDVDRLMNALKRELRP
jgi:histidinol-phosphate/aromatic aminotransferase/cobyric acid decarboxylase-like protein